MKASIVFLLALIFLSCRKEENVEEIHTESKLVGIWNGYQTVEKMDGQEDITHNTPPYNIAFAYDNGIEILDDGTLYGRYVDNSVAPLLKFKRDPNYVDSWKLLNKNQLRLADLEYSILSLTDSELIIHRQVNSGSTITIKLKRE